MNSCISWEIDLADAAKESDYRSTLRLGNTLLTDGDLWFWRSNERRSTRVEVKLPPGHSISTPWKELPAAAGTRVFQPENTPASWSFRIAIGRFPVQLVPVAGTTLRVAAVGVTNPQQGEELAHWIGESAQSVAAVFGYFPRPQAQILIVAVGPRDRPVLFAHVMRGGGKAATIGGSLASATRSGRTAVMRVYWSGAAILLEADARLRALTDGRQSLDTALVALHQCCFNPGRRWSAKELFSQLDRLTGFTVFAEAYEEHVMSEEFPDTANLYRQLGLVPAEDSMQLDPDAPWGRIRHSIMTDSPVVNALGLR